MLKWKGRYPIQVFNADEKIFYQLLENEFLGYPEQTPEKEFCSKKYWIESPEKNTSNKLVLNTLQPHRKDSSDKSQEKLDSSTSEDYKMSDQIIAGLEKFGLREFTN